MPTVHRIVSQAKAQKLKYLSVSNFRKFNTEQLFQRTLFAKEKKKKRKKWK